MVFFHDPRWSQLDQRVSSETDDVTVHGLQTYIACDTDTIP